MAAVFHQVASRSYDDAGPLADTRPTLRLCASSDAPASADDRPRQAVFSALEETVIAIGSRDPLVLTTPGSRLGKLLRLLFGIEPPLPFADRRLEALRTLALAVRRSARRFEAEATLALQAGVTPEQIHHLRSRRT